MLFSGRDEVVTKVRQVIDNCLDGVRVEENKIELKKYWPDLTDKKEVQEFLKDITSIANTYGLDGLLIYGLDEDESAFIGADFNDTKLKDKTNIYDLLVRSLSSPFHIDIIEDTYKGKRYSFIHIPPTKNKPIVIKNHVTYDKKGNPRNNEHRIYVRHGTSVRVASKEQLDLMYYDNNNIAPDYELDVFCPKYEVPSSRRNGLGEQNSRQGKVIINVEIENIGRKPMVITGIKFWVKTDQGLTLDFNTDTLNVKAIRTGRKVDLHSILSANQILSLRPRFIPQSFVSEKELDIIMKGSKSEKVIQVLTSKGQAFFGSVDI